MRICDIMVFNLDFPHCCSNFRYEDSLIVALFTNGATATAHMSNITDLYADFPSDNEASGEEDN